MVKFKGKLSLRMVDSLKGKLDFYTRGDETIVRTWPKNRGKSQTPASIPWQAFFSCFMHRWDALQTGDPPDLRELLHYSTFTPRDFIAVHYWGNANKHWEMTKAKGTPWPPPCPDPLQRTAVFGRPFGSYSILSGVNLRGNVVPPIGCYVWITPDRPRYNWKWSSGRRSRHITFPEIIPSSPQRIRRGYNPTGEPGYSNHTSFHRPLSEPFFFFFSTHPIGIPGYFSTSPWFVSVVDPGPLGTEWLATVRTPICLTTQHIDILKAQEIAAG